VPIQSTGSGGGGGGTGSPVLTFTWVDETTLTYTLIMGGTYVASFAMSPSTTGVLAYEYSFYQTQIVLPNPATTTGPVAIKRTDSPSLGLSIVPYASETIDGASALVIADQNNSYYLGNDRTNWYIIAAY
jgi:hypothetical protein